MQKQKITSRRTTQRRAKRYKKAQATLLSQPLTQAKFHASKYCIQNYGFCANPALTLQKISTKL
jgi:hypothetical protein